MLAASYTQSAGFARGYSQAQDMTAWLGAGGQWIVAEGEGARPAMADELAGIRQFYSEYAPELRIAGCAYCGGRGYTIEPGEYGEPAEHFPCGLCSGITAEMEF